MTCLRCSSTENVKKVRLFWDMVVLNQGYMCLECADFLSVDILSELGIAGLEENFSPPAGLIVIER